MHLGLSVIEMSKIFMYHYWYDYVKPKDGKKAKLCYIDTDSFLGHTKWEDVYVDLAKDILRKFWYM